MNFGRKHSIVWVSHSLLAQIHHPLSDVPPNWIPLIFSQQGMQFTLVLLAVTSEVILNHWHHYYGIPSTPLGTLIILSMKETVRNFQIISVPFSKKWKLETILRLSSLSELGNFLRNCCCTDLERQKIRKYTLKSSSLPDSIQSKGSQSTFITSHLVSGRLQQRSWPLDISTSISELLFFKTLGPNLDTLSFVIGNAQVNYFQSVFIKLTSSY